MTSAGLPPHDRRQPIPGPPAGPPAVRRTRWIALTVIGLAAAAAAACAHPAADTVSAGTASTAAAAQAEGPECTVAGADLLTLTKKDPAEPALHIPLAPGWRELDYRNGPVIAENPERERFIRGVIVNTDIRENNSTPNIEVDLTQFRPQDLSKSDQEITELAFPGAVQGGVVDSRSTDTVCGATIYREDYSKRWGRTAGRPGSALGAYVVQVSLQ